MLGSLFLGYLVHVVTTAQVLLYQQNTPIKTTQILPASNNKMSQPPISAQDIAKVINQVRTNPKSIVPHIQAQLDKFKGNSEIQMSPSFYYSTNEGKGAWTEAIQFLSKQKPLQPLTLHKGLSMASTDHAVDLANHNLAGTETIDSGHTGSDGSTMQQRINRYCIYTSGRIG